MQKKVHKLKDIYPEEFRVVAIAAHQSDYRLSWALNQKLGWELQRSDDLELANKSGDKQHFPTYVYQGPGNQSFYLVANKSQTGFLFPSMTNIDFLLKAVDATAEDVDLIIRKIRQIDFVITAFRLENMKQSDKKKLTF